MRRVNAAAAVKALKQQARTFVSPNVAVTGYPLQIQAVTYGPGARSYFAWESVVQPKDAQSRSMYGPAAERARFSECSDPALDKVDQVVFNTYEGGSAVARNDMFGKEVEQLLIGYSCTEEKYLKKLLKPRTNDDFERRVKYYGLMAIPRAMTTFTLKSIFTGFILSLGPGLEMKAMANAEIDIGYLEPGQITTVMWQGKPIFVHRRTDEQIADVADTPMSELRDPETDAERHIKPEFAVMIAICTHLGCIPVPEDGDYKAYLCPCHGSHYDYSGRIRKGPAPLNLEIPAYYYIDDDTLLIGSSAP